MSQTDIVADSEGNAWFRRNKDKLPPAADPILKIIERNNLPFQSVLEIGCANAWRLAELKERYDCEAVGCDLSLAALNEAKQRFPHIRTYYAAASSLRTVEPYQFDLIVYGFCLYLCDREDLFRIVTEGDRVLKDGGHLIVYDFFGAWPQAVPYHHDTRLRCFKMNHWRLWTANPTYQLVDSIYDVKNEYGTWLLKKDLGIWRGE